MMFPILQVGPLALQMPGLILLAGLWIGLSLTEKHAAKHRSSAELIYNLVFTALVAGIIGARLSYAGRFPSAFADSPSSLISLNPGLLDPFGGMAFAGIAALVYGQRKGLALRSTLDALVPLFGSLAVAFALSNLSSGSGFGETTTMPWGMELWGAMRHPSQVYEAAAALFILVVLWPLVTEPRGRQPGYLFVMFVILSAGARLFLEAFRGDSMTILSGIRIAQVIAWIVMAAGILALGRLRRESAHRAR